MIIDDKGQCYFWEEALPRKEEKNTKVVIHTREEIEHYWSLNKGRDNRIINDAQRAYIDNVPGADKDLYNEIVRIAKRLLNSKVQKIGIFLSPDDAQDKISEIVAYIFGMYQRYPGWVMLFPCPYIKKRVCNSLFRHRKIDEITDREDTALWLFK